jgi:predicted dehydrogenase
MEKQTRVGLVGVGAMGRGHFDNYVRLMEEGFPVELVALCDIVPERFLGEGTRMNIDTGAKPIDASKFRTYTDYLEMMDKEQLDYIDIALPTDLHCEATVAALNKGFHVLCEKPMARSVSECEKMIAAAEKNGRKLMIGQCLRFWPEYVYLKECVDDKRFGEVTCAYFYRGGGTPKWSHENWLLTKERSGGALLDQHIHDVDTINWLFGVPEAVSTLGRNIIAGSGYDAVSTQYLYPDNKVVNAQDDWTLNGDYGFQMLFRVNFEQGSLIYGSDGLMVYPHDGKGFKPELSAEMGYWHEIRYFVDAIRNGTPIETAAPWSTMQTIRIAEAEERSADLRGDKVRI